MTGEETRAVEERGGRSRSWDGFDGILGTVALVAAVSVGYAVLAEPFAGIRVASYLAIWLAGFVAIHRAVAFAQRRMTPGWPRRLVGVGKWLGAIVLPHLVLGVVEASVIARQERVADEFFTRVRGHIESERERTGTLPTTIGPSLSTESLLSNLDYRYGATTFRLSVSVPAIDIDGRTIGYDSESGQLWSRHNDLPSQLAPRRFDGGEACRRSATGWSCQTFDCEQGCAD